MNIKSFLKQFFSNKLNICILIVSATAIFLALISPILLELLYISLFLLALDCFLISFRLSQMRKRKIKKTDYSVFFPQENNNIKKNKLDEIQEKSENISSLWISVAFALFGCLIIFYLCKLIFKF